MCNSFYKQIIYHDEAIIIVEKPSMLLSVPGRGEDKQDSVTSRLQVMFDNVYVVHRLDWETSGLMVFAKTKESQKKLNQQFQDRRVKKQYHAIVFGKMTTSGKIDFPLIADWNRRPKQKVDYAIGKPSCTYWQSLLLTKHYMKNDNQDICFYSTLVKLTPITGRSHQLRVHLAALSHPILGDQLYGQPLAVTMAKRLQLHASNLSFLHPLTNDKISFCSDVPFAPG